MGIKETKSAASLLLIPNPAAKSVTLHHSSNINIESIQIFDNLGREVYVSRKADNSLTQHPVSYRDNNSTIDVSGFAPAVYTVVVKGNDFVVNKKLVVNR